MGWYSEVARDVSKIPEAIKFFESELQDARVEVKLKGNVEKQASLMHFKQFLIEKMNICCSYIGK